MPSADESARKWREGKVRPLPGNSPHDRAGKPGGSSIVKENLRRSLLCHFISTNNIGAPQYAFSRQGGIYRSDVVSNQDKVKVKVKTKSRGGTDHLPLIGPGPRQKNASGGPRPSHRPRLVPHRLFLDRVARQQSPSPLHRYRQNKPWTDRPKRIIIER